MGYSRKWLVDLLCRLSYTREAEDALRVLPEEVDLQQLQRFVDRIASPGSIDATSPRFARG
jgi:hypothetical protein